MSNSDNITTEEMWKPVHRFVGWYSVSNMGRVRSEKRTIWRKLKSGEYCSHTIAEKILSTPPNADGYLIVNLCGNGSCTNRYVHDLVLRAFEGVKKPGQEVRHSNNLKHDARLSNLSYGSRSDNMFDRVRSGTHNFASRTECSNNHPYTDSNTVRFPSRPGTRVCRTCRDEYQRRSAERRLVAA